MPGPFSLFLSVGIHVLIVVLLMVSATKEPAPSNAVNSEIEQTFALFPTKIVTSPPIMDETSAETIPSDIVDARHVDYAGSPEAAPPSEQDADDVPQDKSEESLAVLEKTAPAENDPLGQNSEGVDTEGVQAPRLTIQGLSPLVIDTLLQADQAKLIAVTEEDIQYQLQGTLTQPAGFRRASAADLNQLSQRSIALDAGMTAQCRGRLVSDWGLSREAAAKATIGIWFTNTFDNYLLTVQIKAVSHLPQAERARQKTVLMLKTTAAGVQAAAIPSRSDRHRNH